MGRPKKVSVLYPHFQVGDSRAITRNVERLLSIAGPDPGDDPLRSRLHARLLHLQQTSRQDVVTGPGLEPEIPYWCTIAETNLAAIIRSGALYLKTCKICGALFTWTDKRKEICHRQDCVRTSVNVRVKGTRTRMRDRKKKLKAAEDAAAADRDLAAAERSTRAFGAREKRRNAN
jgi:hypothetical protein